MALQDPAAIDPVTGQPVGGYWGNPSAPDPGAPLTAPAPSPRPVNNLFGGFPDTRPGPGIPAIPDPTGPALPTAGAVAATPFPADPRGAADKAAAGTPGAPADSPFPLDPRGSADSQQPLYVPQTTTESTNTTSGPTAGTVAKIEGATDEANKAAGAAGDAKVAEINATAELERKQARDAYARGVNTYFESWGKKNTEDQINADLTRRLEETSKFKPDRAALFHGDNGTQFGIASAIAAMAGGWLMGQGLTGGKNPYLDVVMRLIDDNVEDQVNANSATYRELSRRLGNNEAAQKELKARMLEATGQTIDAQGRFEKADLVQKGVATVRADVQKEIAKNRLESAKLTGQTASHSVQSQTKMVLNPQATGGVDLNEPKEYEKVGRVVGMVNLLADAKGLAQSNVLKDNVGFLDEAGNWVKEKFNARDPGQAKVDAVINQYKSIMYEAFKTEPNGEMARELASIGVPRNDEEIPLFLQSIERAINIADPGGRYRFAGRALGNQPNSVEKGAIPVVR